MLRTALTPRFLGLFVLALVLAAVFVQLGRWQLGVAEDKGRRQAIEATAARPPVPLRTVLAPHTAFPGELSARAVTTTGHYGGGQLRVPGRRLDGVEGSWVVTPFVVDATGATLPVLRGFVPGGADVGVPPAGTLTLTGGLAPPESPTTTPPTGPGEIGSVDTSILVNTWSGDLYNAFLFLAAEDPATGPQLTKVPTPLGPTGLTWRNAAYAVQWWVFAAFALWMWWRMVREEHRSRAAAADPPVEAGDEPLARAGDNGGREHL